MYKANISFFKVTNYLKTFSIIAFHLTNESNRKNRIAMVKNRIASNRKVKESLQPYCRYFNFMCMRSQKFCITLTPFFQLTTYRNRREEGIKQGQTSSPQEKRSVHIYTFVYVRKLCLRTVVPAHTNVESGFTVVTLWVSCCMVCNVTCLWSVICN